jgi:hypothetical protein
MDIIIRIDGLTETLGLLIAFLFGRSTMFVMVENVSGEKFVDAQIVPIKLLTSTRNHQSYCLFNEL